MVAALVVAGCNPDTVVRPTVQPADAPELGLTLAGSSPAALVVALEDARWRVGAALPEASEARELIVASERIEQAILARDAQELGRAVLRGRELAADLERALKDDPDGLLELAVVGLVLDHAAALLPDAERDGLRAADHDDTPPPDRRAYGSDPSPQRYQ